MYHLKMLDIPNDNCRRLVISLLHCYKLRDWYQLKNLATFVSLVPEGSVRCRRTSIYSGLGIWFHVQRKAERVSIWVNDGKSPPYTYDLDIS